MSRDTARFHVTFPDGSTRVYLPLEYRFDPPKVFHQIRTFSVAASDAPVPSLPAEGTRLAGASLGVPELMAPNPVDPCVSASGTAGAAAVIHPRCLGHPQIDGGETA